MVLCLRHHCLMIGLPNIISDLTDESFDINIFFFHTHHVKISISMIKSLLFGITKDIVTSLEYFMWVPSRITSPANSYSFKDATTAKLINNHLRLETVRHQLIIWLQATDIMRDCCIDT